MEWDWLIGVLPECGAFGSILVFLAVLLKRETAEKKYWRHKAVDYLESLGEVTTVATDFAEEDVR